MQNDISWSNTVRSAALAIVVVVTGGCGDLIGPLNWDDCGACGGPWPTATPYHVRLLRGDTVRYAACMELSKCVVGSTGDVLARWKLTNDTVAAFLGGVAPALVESATSVLVRAIKPGSADLLITFLAKGSMQFPTVTVADSAVIAKIDLISYVQQPNQLHEGGTMSFTARLKDDRGFAYRARPTEMSVSDSLVLELTIGTDIDGGAKMVVRGLRQGEADLIVTFLGVTRTVKLTVHP